ncbi:TonB-dependent receptor [Hephaestia mangrovi]|uniref:TonB-dependent receptor n=1 Tax=Hephaestia mangrovi TaxID=2873268 RepID=UPI001CA72430|nr:TonB-dependent receptor [Hephaestia mangrovi]MBY8829179.1 TonB-dependent receptor [Hephaestia mangrovi]
MARPSFTACLIVSMLACPAAVAAQATAASVQFSLEPQPLDRALTEVGRLTGREIIVAADAAQGRTSPRLDGRMNADEAVRRLLVGSGLVAEFRDDAILVHRPLTADQGGASGGDILVTGSRIRGEASASPVQVITAQRIQNAGQSDLGDVARSLPQSFGGGQNPEVGLGVTGASENQNAASNLNLRGLGADATLTLLNGHRLSYDGTGQGIDISSIPLAAVDRIEIVPDGASALYGSDAVGGVANVILKRDYRGLDTSARVDVPTDGGGVRQLYTATAGSSWDGGGGLVTVDLDHSDPVVAGERDITRSLAPSSTLVRDQSHQGVVATLHQQLVPAITFEMDALYSSRRSSGETPYTATGTSLDFGQTDTSTTRSLEFAPRLVIDASPAWQITLDGLWGDDRLKFDSLGYSAGAVFSRFAGCICNRMASVGINAEGPLFDMPGGSARLAVGAGVRRADLHYLETGYADFDRGRTTTFGYGELALPFISSRNAVPGLQQLLLNLAGRYERYGRDGVLSPKLGLVYTPVPGLDLKATWGRSFKAPTLFQQYSPSTLTVLNATDLGYSSYPAGSTIGIFSGGNLFLRPERAQTWSATVAVHPVGLSGAHLELSYFAVDFVNRVQVPVQSVFNALGNPLYAAFISYSPSPEQVAAALAGASGGLSNQTGRPFDPAQLVAIIDQGYHNVTREHAEGVDAVAGYRIDMGTRRSLDLAIDASYLTSRRRIIPSAPEIPLAGTLFNPPRFRGRAGATWSISDLTVAGFVNYAGGVDDERTAATVRVHGQTTVDLSARLSLSTPGILSGTTLSVSVRNLFDAMPAPIATNFVYAAPYDTTNYSAIGRVLGLQVSHKW